MVPTGNCDYNYSFFFQRKNKTKMNGGKVFSETMIKYRVDTVFACTGNSEMQLVSEIGQTGDSPASKSNYLGMFLVDPQQKGDK